MRWFRRFGKFLEEMKDHKLNRELAGVDKYGNKYYQYYSSFGLPTRREVFYLIIKAHLSKIIVYYKDRTSSKETISIF